MKSKLFAAAVFALTGASVVFYPTAQSIGAQLLHAVAAPPTMLPARPAAAGAVLSASQGRQIEVVFVLDTTSSMSGLIQAAKEKIWSIASTLAQARDASQIRMGLVAYRDRGDAYVTKVIDLSSDLDSMYATLMGFEAQGGGDGPESVNAALHDAVHKISWSQDSSSYRVLFLVGDAPPHMDYANDVKYPLSLAQARSRDIVVNTIQCGQVPATKATWQQIALQGQGSFVQVGQSGNAVALSTPFDAELATLGAKLDDTRLYYGNAREMEKKQRKIEATHRLREKASVAAQARRATFNVSESGAANQFGAGDIVEDLDKGRVDLQSLDESVLPPSMVNMPEEERKHLVRQTRQTREALKQRIKVLSGRRDTYLKERVEAAGGAKDSLDQKLFEVLDKQMESRGMPMRDGAPRY